MKDKRFYLGIALGLFIAWNFIGLLDMWKNRVRFDLKRGDIVAYSYPALQHVSGPFYLVITKSKQLQGEQPYSVEGIEVAFHGTSEKESELTGYLWMNKCITYQSIYYVRVVGRLPTSLIPGKWYDL